MSGRRWRLLKRGLIPLSLCALGFLWSVATASYASAQDFTHRIAGGVIAGKTADADLKPLPLIEVEAETGLTDFEGGPQLHVRIALEGMPDADVQVADPTTVKALSGSVAVVQSIPHARFGVFMRVGTATRLANSEDIATRFPVWGSIGIDLRTPNGENYLDLGGGPDQRLGPIVSTLSPLLTRTWAWCAHVDGRIKVTDIRDIGALYASAGIIRALSNQGMGYGPPRRDYSFFAATVAF